VIPARLGISITPNFRLTLGEIALRDCTVVADGRGLGALGLRMVDSGVTLVSSVASASDRESVFVFVGAPGHARDAIAIAAGQGDAPIGFLVAVKSGALTALVDETVRAQMSVASIATDGDIALVRVVPRHRGDGVDHYLMTLLMAWANERRTRADLTGVATAEAERLRSVISALHEAPPVPRLPPEEDPIVTADAKELVALRKKYDAVQRRYDALAKSRLGRVQLRYWEKRKKRASRG
jgi:GNAT superfamily N-acetyltransferase